MKQIKKLMHEYSLAPCAEDLQLLMYRLDKDKDQKVSFLEFKQALTPQTHYIYQQNSQEGAPLDNTNYRPPISATKRD